MKSLQCGCQMTFREILVESCDEGSRLRFAVLRAVDEAKSPKSPAIQAAVLAYHCHLERPEALALLAAA
jgi:hypothetical protein